MVDIVDKVDNIYEIIANTGLFLSTFSLSLSRQK